MHSTPSSLPILALLTLSLASATPAVASLSLTSLHTPVDSTFAGFAAPAVWATAAPSPGQLNSNQWSMTADGPLTSTPAAFGIDQTGGMGTSTGSESATGVYAFDVGSEVTALGVQPTGTYWTPGMFTLRLKNDTGVTLAALRVQWVGWVFNDQGRSNDLQFLHSADNTTYLPTDAEFNVLSTATAATAPVTWEANPRDITLTNLALTAGSEYYLRWGGDDVAGTGSRDEFALSGVRVTPIPEPSSLGFGLLSTLALFRRSRRRGRG